MNFLLNNKRNLIWVTTFIVVVSTAIYFFYGNFHKAKLALISGGSERIISESPSPKLNSTVTRTELRTTTPTGEAVPFAGSERISIDGGKTVKESYGIAYRDALLWATDAKLVSIQSLGTVIPDGTSSGWEIVFGSKIKKTGYSISLSRGVVTQKKEISAQSVGYDLPKNWYDSSDAIKSVEGLPQFRDATMSGMTFYYNEDGKRWGYGISSSKGTVSIPVR